MKWRLVDIGNEGALLLEITGTIDQHFIMTEIKHQEQTVAETFVGHLKHMAPLLSVLSLYVDKDLDLTMTGAAELLGGISEQLLELNSLKDSAEKILFSVYITFTLARNGANSK